MTSRFEVLAVEGIGEVRQGDDIASLISSAAQGTGITISPGDIVVVAQKIVSKAEGAVRRLSEAKPAAEALSLSKQTGKDPGLVQIVLDQAVRVVRAVNGVLIVETRHGLICANAGVDSSNVPGDDWVTVLPANPDRSAALIRKRIETESGGRLAVIISDSFNRPWREGSMNIAIGVSGFEPLTDLRGRPDDNGRVLKATVVSLADELAAAAQIVMGETGRTPVAVIRGVDFLPADANSEVLLRKPERDLFR